MIGGMGAPRPPRKPMHVPEGATVKMAVGGLTRLERGLALMDEYKIPELPPGVGPKTRNKALDACVQQTLGWANTACPGMAFLGFQFLAELAQISEYRVISTRLAQEMTRRWIRIRSRGEEDKTEQIQKLTEAMEQMQLQKRFCDALVDGGLFGRGQLYIDVGYASDAELRVPLVFDEKKIKKGAFTGLKPVEPMWSYAYNWNAANPLDPWFYSPSSWYVMDKEVHSSRLLTIIPNPVPDILKPAYAFAGMSLSQLAMPTVENFLKMRQSVSNIVLNYSLRGVKTNLEGLLQGGTDVLDSILARVKIYTQQASNEGLMLLDKEMEDFFQHTTPMTNIDKLLDQARDNMCAVANIPRMVLFGLSPEGMNASADGEIAVFNQYVAGQQEVSLRHPIEKTLRLLQLSVLGKVDNDLTFDFVPLTELSEKDEAQIRLQNAQSDNINVTIQAVASDEVRQRLARDPNSGYDNLDVKRVVVPAAPTTQPNPTGSQPNDLVSAE